MIPNVNFLTYLATSIFVRFIKMAVVYRITPWLREEFKKPFGFLIQGSFEETMDKIRELIEKEKPSRIISVGDIVSRNLHLGNINPQLTIIDNKFERKQLESEKNHVEITVYVKNPQGTITKEAIFAVKEALRGDEHTHIVVDGEEDLLVLVAVLNAADGAFVVYGQPHSGIVVVKVSAEKKAEARQFLNEMRA
jgi:uncharacterized protein (UPF0218 family)